MGETEKKSHWRTYKPEQARQVSAGLQILVDKKMLDSDEEKVAKGLLLRLRGATQRTDNDYVQFEFNSEQEDLLSHVEGALWR